MNNNNTTYKDSPLGKIPCDWEVIKISDYGKVYTGNTPPTNDIENYGHEFLFVSPTDLGSDKYILNTKKKLSKKGFSISRKFPLGSVLFTCIGSTIGKSGIASVELTSNQQINAIVVDKKYSNEFLYYALENNSDKIKLLAGEQAVPILNKSQFESVRIICPPLPEQKAIAHVLGLMDSAINTNNQLIAKKELQKKWLMQKLLTGKKRLKGFENNWKEVQLKNAFHFLKSYSISREGLSKETGNQFCIHYGDIHASYETDFLDFKTQKNIPRIVDENYYIQSKDYLKDGDILIADASEDYKGVGEAIVVINLEKRAAVGGLHTIVLRDNSGETESIFRGYLFASESVRNKLRTKATGTSVYSVTKNTLESLTLSLPPVNEQKAIAKVLQAADKEIKLLKAKTEKLREQKKGLMQVLLTGKIRLI